MQNLDTSAMALRLLLLLVALAAKGLGVRVSGVKVPTVVVSGTDVELVCNYQHSSSRPDPLYSVKWYRNVNQFYEYIPNRKPQIRIYSIPQVIVDEDRSAGARVMLTGLTRAASGTYRCEVMSDKPLFETDDLAANMTVVDTPTWGPAVSAVIKRMSDTTRESVEVRQEAPVRPGDLVSARCQLGSSDPPANITWTLNSLPPPLHALQRPRVQTDQHGRRVQVSELELQVEEVWLERGALRLTCRAHLYTVFDKVANLTLFHADRAQQVAGLSRYSTGSSSRASLMLLLLPMALLPFCCSYCCFFTSLL